MTNTETPTTAEYEIPSHRLDAFLDIVAKAAKKSTKLSLPAITFEVVSERPAIVVHGTSFTKYIPADDPEASAIARRCERNGEPAPAATTLTTVAVHGTDPYLEGHRFVANIDHGVDGEPNILSCVPGAEVPEGLVAAWQNAPADCVHCGLNRRRLNTFLFVKDDGSIVQVGRNCLADYFPGHAVEDIARLAQLLLFIEAAAQSDSDYEGGSYTPAAWLRQDVLVQTAAVVREIGWTPKSRASEDRPATAGRVYDALTWRSQNCPSPAWRCPANCEHKVRPFVPNESDVEVADLVAEWVDSLDPTLAEDYLWNLKAACSRQVTAAKHLGLVCSAVGVFEGNRAKEIEKAAETAAQIPVPNVGERQTITGRVLSTKVYDGYTYDAPPTVKYLVLAETDEGTFKVFGTLNDIDPVQGDTVTFTARITLGRDGDPFFGIFKRATKVILHSADEAGTVEP